MVVVRGEGDGSGEGKTVWRTLGDADVSVPKPGKEPGGERTTPLANTPGMPLDEEELEAGSKPFVGPKPSNLGVALVPRTKDSGAKKYSLVPLSNAS